MNYRDRTRKHREIHALMRHKWALLIDIEEFYRNSRGSNVTRMVTNERESRAKH